MKRRSIIFGFAALGGCSSPAATPNSVPEVRFSQIFLQPPTLPTYNNVLPPKNEAGITLWGPIEKFPCPPTSAISGMGEAHIVIDSASIPGNIAARNGLGSVVFNYSFQPWIKADSFRITYDLKVTRAEYSANSVAQVVAYFNLLDQHSNTSLWMGQLAWDSRPGKGGDVSWDAGTNTPLYISTAPGLTALPYTEWKSFYFQLGAAEITGASAALRARYPKLALSSNIRDYALTHCNINPEIAVASGENARIDASIRNWQVYKS
jgi:hypothetical protein